ncbi:MAG: hypothetical protein A2138_02175 [Deltaproteobacteria bacterium RBG_16_71_12]|nr:MAG: hypothetical protein A2138_02175 [Deltaproteobacteria bacterium RBG_16_71_12]
MRASFIGTLLLLVGTACPAPPDGRSACYFQAEDDPRWTDDLDELKDVPASAFQAIEPGAFFP